LDKAIGLGLLLTVPASEGVDVFLSENWLLVVGVHLISYNIVFVFISLAKELFNFINF
jgi:hypothetical protein